MITREYTTNSALQTKKLGIKLAERLQKGDVIALCGELGAGKTCLTQGICRGLGLDKATPVTSPTFTLVNEYRAAMPVYHIDLYRIASDEEFYFSGLDEFLKDDAVTIIEWANKHADVLPDRTLFITITFGGRLRRNIRISCDEGYHDKQKIVF
ncbi:MAG: tRNA (adenosine(37)-N6)-threonylcarbamoyltransferase complex ATPase subunit type 1 TsaE [Candidatus Auribacterota bacterium]|jgi:tRNA threonylcarbamoyladenosine biosynthesis protein TsaE|nr:tRNA (adenosine(37)-N6)-threonylcarbamoyltransferase complex ATPase subunit type 1 TsaE [Candidatus Auribacterota bacterium]